MHSRTKFELPRFWNAQETSPAEFDQAQSAGPAGRPTLDYLLPVT